MLNDMSSLKDILARAKTVARDDAEAVPLAALRGQFSSRRTFSGEPQNHAAARPRARAGGIAATALAFSRRSLSRTGSAHRGRIVVSFFNGPGAMVRYFDGDSTTWSMLNPSSRVWMRTFCVPVAAK